MASFNFKNISAELQTFCRVPFSALDNLDPVNLQFSENPAFNDVELYDEDSPSFDKRKHVYANVWERSLDPRTTGGEEGPSSDTWTIDWRQWPPDVPHIPAGLKIPVEFYPNETLGLMEAVPISAESTAFYESMEGLLNSAQSRSIMVDPPAVLFLRSQVGHFYSVKLRLKNTDSVPRKITIFPPNNACFHVVSPSYKPTIVPGLTISLIVKFKPDSNLSVNEALFIAVEGDGALTVPLVSASIPPPILEIDEWDCGCSVISTSRTEHFEIKNVGSQGRFWFLTEDEFRNEYLSFQKEQHKSMNTLSDNGISNSNGAKSDLKGNTVYTTSFKVNPSCYKLQRNQKVKIKVKYTPRHVGLHYEKLAMMCDNGEVRWIAVKGIGIDIRSKGLVELRAEPSWTAPPVDLNSDVNCRYSIDLGDLLPGDGGKMNFKAINKSCIPLYFFWSVRPLQLSNDEPMGNISFQRFLEGSMQPLEWDDYSSHWHDGIQSMETQVDVKISPSQGILRQSQEMSCCLSASSPKNNLGYYGCVISLFVEQVNDESISIITPLVKKLDDQGLNDVPIHLDDLRRTMPSDSSYRRETQEKDSQMSDQKNPKLSDNMRGSSDGEMEVYTINHGHDKLELLQSTYNGHNKKQTKLHRDQKNPIFNNGSTKLSPLKKETRLSLEFTKSGGEFIPGVDKAAQLHYIKKPDELITDDRTYSPTMDELQTYTEFAKVPPSKKWLKNAALQPIAEVEVWLRAVPLNVQFHPPFIVASGVTMSRVERTINAFNASAWIVEVTWEDMTSEAACIFCEPSRFILQPNENFEFKVTIQFEIYGKVSTDLKGFMKVKRSSMQTPCSIPCSITTSGPFIVAVTPILNFGTMKISSEKMKTLAIKNTGNYPAQWVAAVSAEGLIDEKNRKISPFNRNLEALRLLRVWPTWGVLNPQETLGVNVYFSGEIPGEIAASVKIMVDGIPESALYIPICAEVQSPFLVLEESEITISREAMLENKVVDTTVMLANPTGFPMNFAWQSCLIGRQSQILTAEFYPSAGFVPPRGTMDCILTMSSKVDATLRNVYALCIVDAMKEPLILKISSD